MTIARNSVHYLFGYDLDCESEEQYSPVYLFLAVGIVRMRTKITEFSFIWF
jgi:hypothetical protein